MSDAPEVETVQLSLDDRIALLETTVKALAGAMLSSDFAISHPIPNPGDVVVGPLTDAEPQYGHPAPVVRPPAVDSFSPTSGKVGTSVVISGKRLAGAQAVKFGSVKADFTVDSNRQITATVPSGAETGRILVRTPAGSDRSATVFTVRPLPSYPHPVPGGTKPGASPTDGPPVMPHPVP